MGADATPPKPKPPPLTPKPAPSEIVKRLSFKRDTAPEPTFKRDNVPESPLKRDPVAESPFKRETVPETSFKRDPASSIEEKKNGFEERKKSNNEEKRVDVKMEEIVVKTDLPGSQQSDEPPDKPPPDPPNKNGATFVPKVPNYLFIVFAITPYFQVYAARPSFQLESQGPGLDHASPPASLFESLPSVEYTRLEQEFDALAGAGGEVVEEEEDVPFMDEESCSEPIAETPKRPSQLDIPSRGAAPTRRQGNVQLETNNLNVDDVQSPETPSYSSRPLPLSPSGPLLAHISISSPESSEAPELTPTNSPDPTPSHAGAGHPAGQKPRLASPSSSPTLPSRNASCKPPATTSKHTDPPSRPAQPPPLPAQPAPALPARPVPNFVMPPPSSSSSSVPNLKLDSSSEDVEDEFQDELQFDPTISSGHFGVAGGGFRSTPVTVGVCPTPQPLTPAPTPRPEVPDKPVDEMTKPVDEMTPGEAENLLADRLMERRSRAGSVLSDEQAEEVILFTSN